MNEVSFVRFYVVGPVLLYGPGNPYTRLELTIKVGSNSLVLTEKFALLTEHLSILQGSLLNNLYS